MPSNFTTPLVAEPNDAMDLWILREAFCFWTGTGEGDGDKVTVPVGFVTDFATIPKFLWPIYPPTGLYGKAAVIHDYLYQNAGYFYSLGIAKKYTRLQCDGVFRTGMIALGVPHHTWSMIYHAVREFGAGHFGRPAG